MNENLNFRIWPIIILLFWYGVLSQTAMAQNTPPNLVIIFTDDLGYGDLGVYGHPTIKTPELDRMAHEGKFFTQFYVAASVCTPSRAGLLTGRYPIRTGLVRGLIPGRVLFPNDKTGLPPAEVTIAEVLKQKNYATMAVGKWHLGHLPEFLPTAQGFDSYFGIPYSNDMDYVSGKNGEPGYWNVPLMQDTTIVERPAHQPTLTQRYTEKAVEFINQHAKQPFFLYLAHTMPHIPLYRSDEFEEVSARGLYGDVIEEIDWSVGKVLQTLRDNGIAEHTLVVFTSDNGPWLVTRQNGGSAGLLREGKGTTWEGGMRVPMIAWWPGTIQPNQKSLAFTSSLDLLPTAAALADVPLPDRELDGFNILPVLTEEAPSPRNFMAYYRDDKVYAVRKGPWKAHFLTQTAYPAKPIEKHDPPLLYHLEIDPSEKYNVAADHPEVVEQIVQDMELHYDRIARSRVPSIEAENLVDDIKVLGGKLRIQDMTPFGDEWSNDAQLWWVEAKPGDKLIIPLEAPEKGTYEVFGFFTRARDYGIVSVSVNGKKNDALIEGYAAGIEYSGPLSFGFHPLKKGRNTLEIELVGKDIRASGYSDGYLVGIDGFLLRK